MDPKEKHLEFLQSVISRHNSNSFMIKGWTITICTAIFALAGTINQAYISLVSLVPISIFWILDSFYLANERCFVSLYNAVVNKHELKIVNKMLRKKYRVLTQQADGTSFIDPNTEVTIATSQYSMNFIPYRQIQRNNWFFVVGSRTLLWFYLMLVGFAIGIFVGLLYLDHSSKKEPLQVSATFATDTLLIRMDNSHNKVTTLSPIDSAQFERIFQKGGK